jgi:hypothetical protein
VIRNKKQAAGSKKQVEQCKSSFVIPDSGPESVIKSILKQVQDDRRMTGTGSKK